MDIRMGSFLFTFFICAVVFAATVSTNQEQQTEQLCKEYIKKTQFPDSGQNHNDNLSKTLNTLYDESESKDINDGPGEKETLDSDEEIKELLSSAEETEEINENLENSETSAEDTNITNKSFENSETSTEDTITEIKELPTSAEKTEEEITETSSSADETEEINENLENSETSAEDTNITNKSFENSETSTEDTITEGSSGFSMQGNGTKEIKELPTSAEKTEEEITETSSSAEETEEINENLENSETSAEDTNITNKSFENSETSTEDTITEIKELPTSAEKTEEEITETSSSADETEEINENLENSKTSVEDANTEITETSSSAEETEEINENLENSETSAEDTNIDSNQIEGGQPEEDLTLEFEIPSNLRDKSHITRLLNLLEEPSSREALISKASNVILSELKKIYENAIKPLEKLYKYQDLSNRHFGDPEIFSKPLILFMGPWSGGKSTILNYLTDNEYTDFSVRSGAEPSPAYFNLLMYGNETETLDGTQIAADWTFSGLQKFGQAFLDRLKAVKIPHKLLKKVNIVEIPGILEVRKHVSREFPFNDACQWFIDRADIIFLVYDPSKLDVGPETEAILDQLKGREYQTRILLNKADQVKPEELLRVQNALIWNISPLMSSSQPPLLYTVSLWSRPFESGAPVRLLQAQENALLLDLKEAIEKRIDNKIASARRFAVRVRNHAKMIDCYLTTYYNHKSLFGNKKEIASHIIKNPQQYHIYEGLSTLTNISRYDLPDPEVYREFFNLNPLYTFKRLAETCTYFKGCPIHKLDVAIAYDLPDLIGKYKKIIERN